jgi:hypothetical protein
VINACLALGFADQPDHIGEQKKAPGEPRLSRGHEFDLGMDVA